MSARGQGGGPEHRPEPESNGAYDNGDEPNRRWLVIQHVPYEGPGLIAAEADRRGIELSVCHPYRGDRLPALSDLDGADRLSGSDRLNRPSGLDAYGLDRLDRVEAFDELAGLVVMGGPMGVSDTAAHPYLADEIALLAAAVSAGIPVLGVCLGAQLLASALGARVYRGALPEIGSGYVSLTDDGLADPVLGAAGVSELPVVHWHQDTFDLPSGAVCLAHSELYPNQAFRAGAGTGTGARAETGTRAGAGIGVGGDAGAGAGTSECSDMGAGAGAGAYASAHARVYGLQFHVEVDRPLAEGWRMRLSDGVIDEHVRAESERVGRRVIGAFFDSASLAGSP